MDMISYLVKLISKKISDFAPINSPYLLHVMYNVIFWSPDKQIREMYYFSPLLSPDKPVNHAQDRIFSTAMAVNALLYTWMEGDTLLAETPAAVVETVDKAARWLIENTLSGKYKPWNVVFSGSVKGLAVREV